MRFQIENFQRHQASRPVDSRDAKAVVSRRADDTCNVRGVNFAVVVTEDLGVVVVEVEAVEVACDARDGIRVMGWSKYWLRDPRV